MFDASLGYLVSICFSLGYNVNPLIKNKYKAVGNSDEKPPMVISLKL